MTQEEKRLYNDLFELRENIKDYTRANEGRASLVCTDDALLEIVRLKPKKLGDFEGIKGIGDTFINKYASYFLNVIANYLEENEKAINMNNNVIHTMKELEKKLVNINKRNRLLSLNSLVNKYAFDLSCIGSNNLERLLFTSNKVKVCDIDDPVNVVDDKLELSNQRKMITLLRETNKDLREKGQNDLFIGYPFVIGRLPGEDFDVHAPLVLFPIKEERTPTTITLQLDDSRDIIYNNTLLLAFYKFNKINKPLPDEGIEPKINDIFIKEALEFYKKEGLNIIEQDLNLTKFKEYKANEFPSFINGEIYLETNAILGKFPVCSNSIQKDFEDMIDEKKCNGLVESLLEDHDDRDFYQDSYDGTSPNKLTEEEKNVKENNFVYINDLNSSQEAVLNSILKRDKIVVQGPPGTGKSQTIASLIANFVNNGKTVLMVSEKKTALDVVYSRLGELSSYALLIDDVGNKNLFYNQLKNMISYTNAFENSGTINVINTDDISRNIDNEVSKLEHIAKKLYEVSTFGIEYYKLFISSKKYDYKDLDQQKIYKAVKDSWENKLYVLNAKYNDLVNANQLFKNSSLLEKVTTYVTLFNKYHFMKYMNPHLVGFDLGELKDKLLALSESIEEWKKKNFIVRLFTKGKVNKELKAITNEYFVSCDKELFKFLFNNISLLIESLDNYESYFDNKELYDKLSNLEKEYAVVIANASKLISIDINELNDELFNLLINRQIEFFIKNNKDVLYNISDFNNIVLNIANLIDRKQVLTKEKLKNILLNELNELTKSKRQSEIRRQIESKRHWSVNKFTKKFELELFRGVKIWLLTPEVVSEILPLTPGLFDLVIFDEASQMYVEKGVPAILRGKKVVIAGDQKQLRPSNLGAGRLEIDVEELDEDVDLEAALEEESLLDLARFKYCDVLLNFHYRSKYEELIAFSNYAFYGGRLYVSPNSIEPVNPPIEVHKMEDGMWQNRSNLAEAKYVVSLLKDFFKERRYSETIGIITFNSNQRDLIDDMIDEECSVNPEFRAAIFAEQNRKKDGEDIGLFVKNIENVQGDERDVIIFSIGYAKNEKGRVATNFGWLNQKGGENRLNVAISRAKQKIHIVTSIVPSDLVVESAKNDGPRIFKKYLEYCYAVSNKDKEGAKQVLLSFGDEKNPGSTIHFDSDFEKQVYDALVEKDYEVDTQVGIGGYKIDLAVKKDGKYILGIECDGKLYHSSKIARERDLHRQKYLESRGWKIHRIWSTNWWENRQREIEKICNIVELYN